MHVSICVTEQSKVSHSQNSERYKVREEEQWRKTYEVSLRHNLSFFWAVTRVREVLADIRAQEKEKTGTVRHPTNASLLVTNKNWKSSQKKKAGHGDK